MWQVNIRRLKIKWSTQILCINYIGFSKTRGDKPLKHDPRPSELSARVSLPARITGSISAVPEQRTTHDAEIGGEVDSCKLSYRLFFFGYVRL